MRYWVILFFVSITTSQAMGTTWRVERDGSGDFSLLQECVDAAASGDTILVGSGRYDEWQMYGNNTQYPARMIVQDKDLTVIGEPDGSSVIGPVEYTPGQHHGIVLFSNSNLIVQDMRIENLFGGVMSWVGGNTTLHGCFFLENYISVFLDQGEGTIVDCDFDFSGSGANPIYSYWQDKFVLMNSSFEHLLSSQSFSACVVVTGCQEARMDNCQILGPRTGIQIDSGSVAIVNNCHISQTEYAIISDTTPSSCLRVTGCIIEDSDFGFCLPYQGNCLMVEETVLSEIHKASLYYQFLDGGYIRDSVLSKGEWGVVTHYPHIEKKNEPITDFDMRHNYWGTDSPDSIQAWIEDFNDNPSIEYKILWEPFNDQPVANEPATMGSIKSLFR